MSASPTRRPMLLPAPQGPPLLYTQCGPNPRSASPTMDILSGGLHGPSGWTTFQSILLLLTIPSPYRDLPARGQRPARCYRPACPHFPSTPLGCTGHRSHLGAFLVGLKGGLHSQSDLNDMVAGCSVQVPRSTQERCSVPGGSVVMARVTASPHDPPAYRW